MRKELLWAIFAGIFFGLIIAFGVWRANSSFRPKREESEVSPSPSSKNPSFKIVLNTPENEDVVTESSVTVSGITSPLSWITLSGEDSDYIIQADEKGGFSENIDLISGVNQITITAFNQKGSESGTKVLVVYSSAFEKKEVTEEALDKGTSESAIRVKVEEKVKIALSRPKAYLGTITDITDSTIQIKSLGGEIRQISAKAGEVTVIKTGKIGKEVKLTDIALGDFIVAMGYKNANQVLSAQRILITDPVADPKINVFLSTFGEITAKSDKNTVAYSYTSGKTSKIKVASIKDTDKIIYVTNSSLRTIFAIQ